MVAPDLQRVRSQQVCVWQARWLVAGQMQQQKVQGWLLLGGQTQGEVLAA